MLQPSKPVVNVSQNWRVDPKTHLNPNPLDIKIVSAGERRIAAKKLRSDAMYHLYDGMTGQRELVSGKAIRFLFSQNNEGPHTAVFGKDGCWYKATRKQLAHILSIA